MRSVNVHALRHLIFPFPVTFLVSLRVTSFATPITKSRGNLRGNSRRWLKTKIALKNVFCKNCSDVGASSTETSRHLIKSGLDKIWFGKCTNCLIIVLSLFYFYLPLNLFLYG